MGETPEKTDGGDGQEKSSRLGLTENALRERWGIPETLRGPLVDRLSQIILSPKLRDARGTLSGQHNPGGKQDQPGSDRDDDQGSRLRGARSPRGQAGAYGRSEQSQQELVNLVRGTENFNDS